MISYLESIYFLANDINKANIPLYSKQTEKQFHGQNKNEKEGKFSTFIISFTITLENKKKFFICMKNKPKEWKKRRKLVEK